MAESRRSSVTEVNRANDGVLRVNDQAIRRMSQARDTIGTEVQEARGATEREHNTSVRDSIKLYKKAIAFSLVLSTAVVMEGMH
jgi:SP family general alpha glucoside:H+ symporter-like MFS transporter